MQLVSIYRSLAQQLKHFARVESEEKSNVMADDTCANPLLLGWIKEWLDKARQRNSKGVSTCVSQIFFRFRWITQRLLYPPRYKRAYESMKACPLTFSHPSEAQQLNGLGSKLCDRLVERLKEHCEENGLQMPELPQKGKCLFADVKLTTRSNKGS